MTLPAAPDPADALLRRTRMRLASFTLLMVSALIVAVGVTTALMATALMHEGIDRALDAAVADRQALHELVEEDDDEDTARLGSADTFVMVSDASGGLIGSSADSSLPGLPDESAIRDAADGIDRREGTFGGVDVRLLTIPMPDDWVEDEEDGDGGGSARGRLFLQAGFVLTMHLAQERELLLAIAAVGLLGILGAALVTLLITRQALVPIRHAFATERRFVASASHELRTPVAIIRASAEILEREGLVREAGRPLVGDIVSETGRLGRLVGDMLELASIEAGAVALEPRPVALGTWLSEVARRAGSVAEAAGVGLRLESDDQVRDRRVLADRDRLDQLLLVLVDNAVRHSPAGAVVRLRLSVLRDTAVITVTDQGPGVPPADRERIFEPFARVPGTPRRGEGTGLGLAIGRQLARRHGGDLVVDEGAGEGATFRLTLPLLSHEAALGEATGAIRDPADRPDGPPPRVDVPSGEGRAGRG